MLKIRTARLSVFFLTCAIILSTAVLSHATTFTVTKTADTIDGVCDADCSLRDALYAAWIAPTTDEIVFAPLFNSPQTITLNGNSLVIPTNQELTVTGPGANLLNIYGNYQSRVLEVQSNSTVTLKNMTVSGGTIHSSSGGGGIESVNAKLTISNLIVRNNISNGTGGGILSYNGELTIDNTLVTNNFATSDGGGIYGRLGMITITNSTISDNSGAGIYKTDGTLSVSNTVISNNRGSGLVHDGTAALNNVTVADNGATGIGVGGTMTINNSRITGNAGGAGAGGISIGNADVTINNSTISFNRSTGAGGGIFTIGGLLNINSSTIANNSAETDGGGIFNQSAATVVNSTICSNTAGGKGGGIFVAANAPQLVNTTVAANTAVQGGGIFGSVDARSSLFADNSAADIEGTFISKGYNLIENKGTSAITGITTGNIIGQDARLLPLGDFGGARPTAPLHSSSPAIDAADPNNFPPTDERGVARPQDGDLNGSALPDIGAYEKQVTAFTVTKTADTGDGACDADCSLREAVAAVNNSAAVDKLIVFDAAIFGTPQIITLTGGELNVANSGIVSIIGAGAGQLTINGSNSSRVFAVNPGALALFKDFTISGGNAPSTASFGGGAIYNNQGILTLADLKIDSNNAYFSGGGIYNFKGKIAGSGLIVTNNASNRGGGGIFNELGTLSLNNSTVGNNTAQNDGGGIRNAAGSVTLTESFVTSNRVILEGGGGLYSYQGTTKIDSSTVSDNRAGTSGGGVKIQGGGTLLVDKTGIENNLSNTSGGGVDNSGGALTFTNSTIANNTAQLGGGLYNFYNYLTPAAAGFVNSTVSGNRAFYEGGGIYNGGGTLDLASSTVAFNDAGYQNVSHADGGGIFNTSSGTVKAQNTIIASNAGSISAPEFSGTLTLQGYNLIKNTQGITYSGGASPGNLLGVDPRLAVLASNGGRTKTHALPAGSPAIDKGFSFLPADQRGVTRPKDGDRNGTSAPDIGAYERDPLADSRVPFDFDGDGKTDISIFRPAAGEWWYSRSSDGQVPVAQFGLGSDKLVAADFTGDGQADIAVWRPTTGEWFVLRSEDGSYFSFPFGTVGDIPLVGDFDGDGKADAGVFRPSTSVWYIRKSSGGTIIQQLGQEGDVPVAADYDGDGKTDLAIFRPNGFQGTEWWYLRSIDNQVRIVVFGRNTDQPVPGDYTGDGKADAVVFRASTNEWFILRSEDSTFYSVVFGAAGDLPVPGDYDGDGRFDVAVFRPTGSTWYINRTTAGTLIANFGTTGDKPVPHAFVP